MSVKKISVFVIVALLAVVLLSILPVLMFAGISRRTDIDINSGDLRFQLRICLVPLKSQIRESRLSQEVGRLGIAIPAPHEWKWASEEHLVPRMHDDGKYGMIFNTSHQIVNLLACADAPDAERRAILEKFMRTLRTRTPDDVLKQGHELLVQIDGKYNLDALDLPSQ